MGADKLTVIILQPVPNNAVPRCSKGDTHDEPLVLCINRGWCSTESIMLLHKDMINNKSWVKWKILSSNHNERKEEIMPLHQRREPEDNDAIQCIFISEESTRTPPPSYATSSPNRVNFCSTAWQEKMTGVVRDGDFPSCPVGLTDERSIFLRNAIWVDIKRLV